ncbi:MAG TPA: ribonuclease H-like domain-containing protein [Balneolaceae bacterium]|nr:ribonuclease H-like domain-containing protein [Balneolaceae bacterium]
MFFVFDIETIPDFDFIRQVLQMPNASDEDALEIASEELARNKSGFLPPMYHQMVSWVGLWIENNGIPKQKSSWNGTDEVEGLEAIFDSLNTYKDFGLIHHNGRGFDLPVITYRSMKHGLQMPRRLSHYDISYRYSDQNIDLKDEFSNYGASSWPKLGHLGQLIGIPVKQTGKGNQVLAMFNEGRLDDIEHYCYEDVMGTYIIWLHLKYTAGDIGKELFDNLQERAMNKLDEIQAESDGEPEV